MKKKIKIIKAKNGNDYNLLDMRIKLWPEASMNEHKTEQKEYLSNKSKYSIFVAVDEKQRGIGFSEVALRSDYVNGCDSSPVGYLEGIYVEPNHRKHGIAKLLCKASEEWAMLKDCKEFASDALIDNTVSHKMHLCLGFEETERVVYYKKKIS